MKRLKLYDKDMVDAHRRCCEDIVGDRLDNIDESHYSGNQKAYLTRIRELTKKDKDDVFVALPETIAGIVEEIEGTWYQNQADIPREIEEVNDHLCYTTTAIDGTTKRHDIFNYGNFVERKGRWSKEGKIKRGGGIPLMRVILDQVRYCPYCNADLVYAMEIDEGGLYKSAFDHFYPKSRYPFLAISLYNLIPCCDRCNSKFKLDKYEETWNTFCPYCDDVDDNAEFIIKNYTDEMWRESTFPDFELKQNGASVGTGQTSDIRMITLVSKGSTQATTKLANYKKLFRIDDVYSILYSHEALKVLQQAKLLSPEHVKNINGLLSSAKIRNIDPWELFVGTPLNRSRINQFHLAKMKLDLLKSYCGVEIQEN